MFRHDDDGRQPPEVNAMREVMRVSVHPNGGCSVYRGYIARCDACGEVVAVLKQRDSCNVLFYPRSDRPMGWSSFDHDAQFGSMCKGHLTPEPLCDQEAAISVLEATDGDLEAVEAWCESRARGHVR